MICFNVILFYFFSIIVRNSFLFLYLCFLIRDLNIRHTFSIKLKSKNCENQLRTQSIFIRIFVSTTILFFDLKSWFSFRFFWKMKTSSLRFLFSIFFFSNFNVRKYKFEIDFYNDVFLLLSFRILVQKNFLDSFVYVNDDHVVHVVKDQRTFVISTYYNSNASFVNVYFEFFLYIVWTMTFLNNTYNLINMFKIVIKMKFVVEMSLFSLSIKSITSFVAIFQFSNSTLIKKSFSRRSESFCANRLKGFTSKNHKIKIFVLYLTIITTSWIKLNSSTTRVKSVI